MEKNRDKNLRLEARVERRLILKHCCFYHDQKEKYESEFSGFPRRKLRMSFGLWKELS